jgi:hypothetical protein
MKTPKNLSQETDKGRNHSEGNNSASGVISNSPPDTQSPENKIKDAIRRLKLLYHTGDTEVAHSKADDILLEFVPHRIKLAWEKVPKWYA